MDSMEASKNKELPENTSSETNQSLEESPKKPLVKITPKGPHTSTLPLSTEPTLNPSNVTESSDGKSPDETENRPELTQNSVPDGGNSSGWETDTSVNTNIVEPPAPQNASQQNNNQRPGHNRNNNSPFYSREGFFMHYLFINLSVRYATYFKVTSRRLLEFFALVNALAMLAILVYVHVTFIRCTNDCLNHVKDIWPKTGILRVQVSNNESLPQYKMYFMDEPFVNSLSIESSSYNTVLRYAMPVSYEDVVNFKSKIHNRITSRSTCPNNNAINNYFQFLEVLGLRPNYTPVLKPDYATKVKRSFYKKMRSIVPDVTVEYKNKLSTVNMINQELLYYENVDSKYDPFEPSPIRDFYAIEYSEEFGFLRLSTESRNKLAIPTLVVNLNPEKDVCFSGAFKKFMLSTFLGYDDYIMTSIKKLAEKDNSQGYLHNLVTGEYFRFVTMSISHASSGVAFLAMVVFTLAVTMLLRYSYHQIFVFMVDLLRLIDTDTRLIFPAAPMLTIILALVGMEEIMTEFFHDSTVAFYVILLLWGADQFDVICLHTTISRRHWVRFFFLYHFSFYIYHYRFNGQYSKLALYTSWLFIQHSMLYFLHHYELPLIRNQLIIIQNRNNQQARTNNNNEPDNSGNNPAPSEPPADQNPINNFPNPLDGDLFLDDDGDQIPTHPTIFPHQLFMNLHFVAAKVAASLRDSVKSLWEKIVSIFLICKSDICKMCTMGLFCIAVVVCTAVLIHLNLNRASTLNLELQKIDKFV